MITRTIISAAAACLAAALLSSGGPAMAAEYESEISSGTVGLVKLVIPAGRSRAMSVPLTQPAVYSGTVSGVVDGEVVVAGAAWAAGEYGPFENRPHFARFVGGPADGLTAQVLSHTGNALVVETGGLAPEAGDRVEIIPADTLGGLFGGPEGGILADADPARADNVMVHSGEDWVTYYHDGTTWRTPGDSNGDHAAVALPPDRGIFFVRRGRSHLRLTVAGELGPTANAIVAPASTTTFLAHPFAVSTRLSKLGLNQDPAWKSASTPGSADLVHLYNGRQWKTYFYDGRRWRASNGQPANPVVVRGSALVAERRGPVDVASQPEPPYPLE